jgi:hypothetical protein
MWRSKTNVLIPEIAGSRRGNFGVWGATQNVSTSTRSDSGIVNPGIETKMDPFFAR